MEKDLTNENDATKAEKRPKLQSIDGNPSIPTSTPKIRRIAQLRDVLFPMEKVKYRSIKSKSPLYHQGAGFCEFLEFSPKPKKTNFSLGKCSLKVNFNLQSAIDFAAYKGTSKNV